MPILTIIGLIPTALSIINGLLNIIHNPSNATALSSITTAATAAAASFAIHGAVTAHQKINASAPTNKPIDDATKPGH